MRYLTCLSGYPDEFENKLRSSPHQLKVVLDIKTVCLYMTRMPKIYSVSVHFYFAS